MTTCSALWDEADLPAYGTAPEARFFVAVEQNGPWGRDALVESHLDPAIGAALRDASLASGGRALLVRDPVDHADTASGVRRVLVSGGAARPWLLAGELDDPARLLTLPFDRLAQAEADEIVAGHEWLAAAEPMLLVCTNGKRDRCCALRGRLVATELGTRHPGRVWECSHTGGHRFAPTGIVLPVGQAIARLDTGLAEAALLAAGRREVASATLGARHDRGLCRLPAERAAAESVLRARTGRVEVPLGLDASGVRVVRRPGPVPLPESCGAEPVESWVWAAAD